MNCKKNGFPNSDMSLTECHVQEQHATFRNDNVKWTPFPIFPPPLLACTSLFFTILRRITYAWTIKYFFELNLEKEWFGPVVLNGSYTI